MEATPVGPVEGADYTGWAYALECGPFSVTDVASDPVRVARTPRVIRRNPVDFYYLAVAQRPGWTVYDGRRTHLRAGDAMLVDSNEPLTVTPEGFGHFLVLSVPRRDLRRDLRVGQSVLGQVVPAENPTSRVLMATITELGRTASEMPAETLVELGYTASELLISTLRLAQRGDGRLADAQLSRNAQLPRMQDFVRRNLARPDLSPGLVAAAFDVSIRYTELVFREGGSSPSRFIRETRLAEARRMLADPRQRHRSIAAIGCSVGIHNPSVFARTFRGLYATTPREYRQSGGMLLD